jgi:hypothetical protein
MLQIKHDKIAFHGALRIASDNLSAVEIDLGSRQELFCSMVSFYIFGHR